MRTHLLLFFSLLLFAQSVSAQKTVTPDQQLWLGVFNQTRLSNRWGFWFDGHLRLRDHFTGDFSQAILRPGLTFYAADDLRFTAGYAYVHHFPAEGHENVARPEHRPWQQVQWFVRPAALRLMQWIRLEERFRRKIKDNDELAEGYNFNYRIRYNFALFLPLTGKKFAPGGLQFLLNDEIHINFGKNITYNYFDQNRFFAGLVYQLTPLSQLHGGYMNVFQQLPAGNQFRSLHCMRLFYFHNIDLRQTQPKR